MARKIPNWVFIDTQTNEAFCKRCGQRERPPLPAPISTFVKWCEYFGDKHKGCAIAVAAQPQPNIGDYNIPLTSREVLFQLSNGTPIQIGRSFLEKALLMIRIHCSNSEIDVQTDRDHAYLTPRKCELNALGRKKIEERD